VFIVQLQKLRTTAWKSVVDCTILNAIFSSKREMLHGKTESLHLETAWVSKRQFLVYRSNIADV